MVHNIYNKSEVFFFQNNETGEKWMVGDRNELVKYLCKFIWRNNSNTGYNNPILDDYSLTGKDKRAIEVKIGYVSSICGPHPIYETRYVERKYSILDGYDRHIDIHIFDDEIKELLSTRSEKYSFAYWARQNIGKKPKERKKVGPRTTSHSCRGSKRMSLMHQTLLANEELDELNKEYGFNLRKKNYVNKWDYGWKDRRVESNWKHTSKVPSQHNLHNAGKNNESIRKDFYEDEIFDMDELLMEDFS